MTFPSQRKFRAWLRALRAALADLDANRCAGRTGEAMRFDEWWQKEYRCEFVEGWQTQNVAVLRAWNAALDEAAKVAREYSQEDCALDIERLKEKP